MLTATHTVLLGEDADAQSCVATALPPMALGRLRRTCRGASGAAPVGVDWARLCQPNELAAAGELRALQYLYLHDKDNPDPWYMLCTAARHGRGAMVAWILEQEDFNHPAACSTTAACSTPERRGERCERCGETRGTLRGTLRTLRGTLRTLRGTLQTLRGTLQTLWGTLQTPRGTLRTPRGNVANAAGNTANAAGNTANTANTANNANAAGYTANAANAAGNAASAANAANAA
jgi:hypothetical protein